MENFTNETLDVSQLPKFEEVQFSTLHPNYWKITLINLFLFFFILGTISFFVLFFNPELVQYLFYYLIVYVTLILFFIFFSRLSFKKKCFAFRTHDVLYRYGVIATNTLVIPYNRIQHVALHEGIISRYFNLSKIEIFTAGGESSDIKIPGIDKEQAKAIKQLVMGKIQKQL
jgi:membrane protein YdbS with pleckstrin-like domain